MVDYKEKIGCVVVKYRTDEYGWGYSASHKDYKIALGTTGFLTFVAARNAAHKEHRGQSDPATIFGPFCSNFIVKIDKNKRKE